jgi:hypothetical protein
MADFFDTNNDKQGELDFQPIQDDEIQIENENNNGFPQESRAQNNSGANFFQEMSHSVNNNFNANAQGFNQSFDQDFNRSSNFPAGSSKLATSITNFDSVIVNITL